MPLTRPPELRKILVDLIFYEVLEALFYEKKFYPL